MESLTLVANFSGNIRRETLGGRKFIVAPLTMIVPGVLNGSQGPLYYPEDEVVSSTPYWDGIILTDDHLPVGVNGKKIKTQQEYALGYVQDPQIKNNRLMAEGWFDVDRTRRLNPKILTALEQGGKIELSTGLSVDFDNTAGVHNGRAYNQVVRKYRPDHLAVLIGKRGACSLNDGCGINNESEDNMLDQDELDTEDFDLDIEQDDDVDNEEVNNEEVDNTWSDAARRAAADAHHNAALAHARAMGGTGSSSQAAARMSSKAQKLSSQTEDTGAHEAATRATHLAYTAQTSRARSKNARGPMQAQSSNASADKAHAEAANLHFDIERHHRDTPLYNEDNQELDTIDNAWSDAARKAAQLTRKHKVGSIVHDKRLNYGKVIGHGKGGQTLVDFGNKQLHIHQSELTRVIYKDQVKNATTLQTDASGKVIKGKKTKKKVMPSDCSDKSVTNNNHKENKMALTDTQKNELIDNVINNCACYTEDDREDLSSLDDRMLSSIANGIEAEKKVKKEKELVANAEATKEAPKVIDINSLPVEVQRVLNYGAAAIQRDKEVLIDKLVVNQATDEAKKARREVLSKLSLEELQDRVSDLPVEKVDNSTFDMNRLIGNFSGAAAGGFKVANESGPAGGQLGSPEIQWNKN